jgi:hypothetical protein
MGRASRLRREIVRLTAKYDRRDPQTVALLNAIEQATPPSTAG